VYSVLEFTDQQTHRKETLESSTITGALRELYGSSLQLRTIYVDDILGAAAFQCNMLNLLAAIIEAIFLVYGIQDITFCQCPLSLEKWLKLIVGPIQIVLGLVVDTNRMIVGMTDEYIQKCRDLLNLWDQYQRCFKVGDMQKLVGKLAQLGKGAPWIYKFMSHL
jgi:hypothetical protein